MGRRKATVSEADPLLKAIIGKLPPAATAWSIEQRKAWLHMMEMAFDVVYGPAESFAESLAALKHPSTGNGSTAAMPAQEHAGFDYYIDAQGNARNSVDDGLVLPSDVGDEMVYDYRRGPARDRETIIWADGSVRSVPGMNFCGPG